MGYGSSVIDLISPFSKFGDPFSCNLKKSMSLQKRVRRNAPVRADKIELSEHEGNGLVFYNHVVVGGKCGFNSNYSVIVFLGFDSMFIFRWNCWDFMHSRAI